MAQYKVGDIVAVLPFDDTPDTPDTRKTKDGVYGIHRKYIDVWSCTPMVVKHSSDDKSFYAIAPVDVAVDYADLISGLSWPAGAFYVPYVHDEEDFGDVDFGVLL